MPNFGAPQYTPNQQQFFPPHPIQSYPTQAQHVPQNPNKNLEDMMGRFLSEQKKKNQGFSNTLKDIQVGLTNLTNTVGVFQQDKWKLTSPSWMKSNKYPHTQNS